MERVMIFSKEFPKLRVWAREEYDIYSFVNSCRRAGFKTVKYEPDAHDFNDYNRYSISAEEYTWFILRWS